MSSIFEASASMTQLPVNIIQQFNFTEAESRLCLALVQGKSLDDIADEYQQPRSKLRGQFDTLLDKTGTDTEAKLITVVLAKTAANT